MYCTKCGAELQEGTKFCIHCGNSIARDTVESGAGKTPKVKSGNRKWLIVGAVAFIGIVISAVVLLSRGFGAGLSSPEEAFEAYLNGYSKHDFDLMLRAYPDFRIEYNGGRDKMKEELQENYDIQVSKYADNDIQIIYKAVGHSILDGDEAESIEQGINDTFGVDVSFSAVATVDYQLIVVNGDTENVSTFTGGYAVRYKGRWYYFNVM